MTFFPLLSLHLPLIYDDFSLIFRYQIPLVLSSTWLQESYDLQTLKKPFLIDIGCAEGLWLINSSPSLQDQYNLLGIDIRPKIIDVARHNQQIAQITNLSFLSTNANVNLSAIFAEISKVSNVQMLTIQFPDPCFKSRHLKRRLITKEFIDMIVKSNMTNLNIFIQSDHEDLMIDTINTFRCFPQFRPSPRYSLTHLSDNPNPFDIPTRREVAYLAKGLPIYRILYETTDAPT